MRLSDKLDTIMRLHAEGRPLVSSDRLPIEEVSPEAIASTGHKTSQKPPFAYLFEASSAVHSPWMPDGGPLGEHSFIGAHSYINGGGYLRDHVLIGRYCSIGRRATIAAGMHAMDGLSTSPALSIRPKRPDARSSRPGTERPAFTVIESDVWIGDGTIIMPGVRLATGCVIGANSVVTRDTLPYGIYAGAPASLRRRRFRDETCAALVESAWWDVPYPALKAMPLDRIEEFLAKLAQIDPPQVAVMATYAVSA